MTDEEIEAYRQRLNELTAKCSDEKPEPKIKENLKKLARKVGASTFVMWVQPSSSSIRSTPAETPELIRNINQALLTASMINMSKTAARNYEIALTATETTSTATKIAARSMRAAWVAALAAAFIALLNLIAVLAR